MNYLFAALSTLGIYSILAFLFYIVATMPSPFRWVVCGVYLIAAVINTFFRKLREIEDAENETEDEE